jgi:hypothetical protein
MTYGQWEGTQPIEVYDETNSFYARSSDYMQYDFDHLKLEEFEGMRLDEVGTAWTNTSGSGERKVTTIEAYETVVVPAGTFHNCIKYHKENLDTLDPTPEWYEWYKPGLFMVKWVDYWGGGSDKPQVYELHSWSDE